MNCLACLKAAVMHLFNCHIVHPPAHPCGNRNATPKPNCAVVAAIAIVAGVLGALLCTPVKVGTSHGSIDRAIELVKRTRAALHQYALANGRMPPIVDEHGLSWRVHILPFMNNGHEIGGAHVGMNPESPLPAVTQQLGGILFVESRDRANEEYVTFMPLAINLPQSAWTETVTGQLSDEDGRPVIVLAPVDGKPWFAPHSLESGTLTCRDLWAKLSKRGFFGRMILGLNDGRASVVPLSTRTTDWCAMNGKK